MATINRTPSKTWKAVVRKQGRPTTIKTFRTRRDASDWALLKACDAHSNPMLGWIVRVALYTGMRAGEIRTLTRRQVNIEARIAHLSETRTGSSRTVPLTRNAVAAFRQTHDNPVRPLHTDRIFFSEPGRDKLRRPYEFRPARHRTVRASGFDGLRFHDLRHQAVSRLVEVGLGDQEVAAISGQQSMQMPRRYTHLRTGDLVTRMDRAGLR